MGEDYTSDWQHIVNVVNGETSSPIALVENLTYEGKTIKTRIAYRCDVCKKTPCKHFEMEDGHPQLTKEAQLINKLAGESIIHTQPSAEGEPTRIGM